ncbi:MAG: tyrosine-type recombinase/integrase [Candidatus Methylomirabilales bacterium]
MIRDAARWRLCRARHNRHTFASRLAMAGVDLYTVQRAGGWKTAIMVQRYAHLSPDHMRAAMEKLAGAPLVKPQGDGGRFEGMPVPSR